MKNSYFSKGQNPQTLQKNVGQVGNAGTTGV
jgi:hypothetical protein